MHKRRRETLKGGEPRSRTRRPVRNANEHPQQCDSEDENAEGAMQIVEVVLEAAGSNVRHHDPRGNDKQDHQRRDPVQRLAPRRIICRRMRVIVDAHVAAYLKKQQYG